MISAIILAAGESRRMGQPKMLLPWGDKTVLGQVISTFQQACLQDILVVTGGGHMQVEQIVKQHGARSVFNHHFAGGEMLSSIQLGLASQLPEAQAALIALGDQPQVQTGTVIRICETFLDGEPPLIVPSFRMRRGHPWLIKKSLWQELLEMRTPLTPRDFLNRHATGITYLNVETPTVLADLDTPEDYQESHP